jgi:two-component system, NtrC family, response regulator HydG
MKAHRWAARPAGIVLCKLQPNVVHARAAPDPRYDTIMGLAVPPRVLVVEADGHTLGLVRRALPPACAVEVVGSAPEGAAALARGHYDVVISDSDAGELGDLRDVALVIVDRAAPLDERVLSTTLRRVVEVRGRPMGEPTLVGSAPAFVAALDAVDRVASSSAPVLLVGETGVGKDALAARIHARGPRRHRPFVVVNAGAIPPTLLDSELFGHIGGAFTGATRPRRGLIAEADGGTVFLDEITDVPLELQGRLLRVVEGGLVRAIGSDHERRVDVRFLAATQRPLGEAVRRKAFREDLFYRLDVLSIEVPPLRERPEDILPLATFFFDRARARHPDCFARELGPDAREALVAASWPGNVRQLAAVIERVVVFGRNPVVERADLRGLEAAASRTTFALPPAPSSSPLPLRALTAQYVDWVLAQTDGDKARAAAILEVDVSTLYRLERRRRDAGEPR